MNIWFVIYLIVSFLNILYCLYKVENWKFPTSVFIWNAIYNLFLLWMYFIGDSLQSTEATWVTVVISANLGCWFGMFTSRD